MLVCLFDIDGTLLSSSGSGRLAMDAALVSEFGVHVPILQSQISGRTDRSIARDQFALHGIDDTPANWQRFINAYIANLPASLQRNGGRVLPGVAALVERLRSRPDTAVGLLTGNVPEGARIKLAHFGIDAHFDFGAYGHEHHSRDEVAHSALALVRGRYGDALAADRVWVIGDTPWDVRCAHAIGARSIAVATGIYSVDDLTHENADIVLPDLSDPSRLWELWDA